MNYQAILTDQGTAHFAISGQTGAVAAAASTKLTWYFWWNSTTKIALVKRVELEGVIATTAFAVGQVLYTLKIARGFSAENNTPGGTALTVTGSDQRIATPDATSAVGVVRISSTAALAAPTWTLDDNPVGSINSHSSAGVNAATPIIGNQYIGVDGVLFNADVAGGDKPIILHANEGLALNVTTPGTGVWTASVGMKWAEADRIDF